jgi:nitroreductase
MGAIDAILARRGVGRLSAPGPSEGHLDAILRAAAAAPDHEGLRPWRFVVLEGQTKDAFGEVLAKGYLARSRHLGMEPTEGQLEKERTKLDRAPTVVVVGAQVRHHPKVPAVEQVASAAAAAQNALVAATALGYGSMWRTGDAAYDPVVKSALGLRPGDALVGFLYLGTASAEDPPDPHQPELDGVVLRWQP